MRSRGIARAVRPTRDPFFDNAKFLLIVLVVVGHNWYPAIDDLRVVKAAYLVVYTVHIPAFVLLSGYFSRGFEGRRKQWRKLVTGVLLPYLIFETAYAAEAAALSGHGFSLHLSSPIYVTWFLLALFVWRASAPLWRSLPHPVLLAVAVSLVAGVAVPSTDFALSRTLQLMPWFVLGLQLHRRHFAMLHRRWARLAGAAAVVVAAVVAYLVAPGVDARWLDREWDAGTLGVPVAAGLVIALGITVLTAPMIAAVLALVPRNRSLLTRLGALTMYPFLLHGLVVRVVQHLGVHRTLIGWGLGGVALVTLGAVLLAVLLALPVVRRLTWWAVEPGRIRLPAGRRAPTTPEGEAPAATPPEADAEHGPAETALPRSGSH
jgi:fucose 4-O-acetylase-like acetyltransferase